MTISVFLAWSRRPYPILGRDPYSLSKLNIKPQIVPILDLRISEVWIWVSEDHLGTSLGGGLEVDSEVNSRVNSSHSGTHI